MPPGNESAQHSYLIHGRYSVRRTVRTLEKFSDLAAFSRLTGCGLQPVSEASIYHNGSVKFYPDGGAVVFCASRNLIREAGFEEHAPAQRTEADDSEGEPTEADDSEGSGGDVSRSLRRARAAVSDLVRASGLDVFVTITCDPAKVDRMNDEEVFRKLHNWLDNNVRRHGLTYVLIPEYHKKGGLHFHGVFNRALPLVDSGTLKVQGSKSPRKPRSRAQRAVWLAEGAQVVYNLPAWPLGFSTAFLLAGEQSKVLAYVCKYIGKGTEKIGGRWYYSGGDLKRPQRSACDLNFDEVKNYLGERGAAAGGSWTIEELNCEAARVRLGKDELYDFFSSMAY